MSFYFFKAFGFFKDLDELAAQVAADASVFVHGGEGVAEVAVSQVWLLLDVAPHLLNSQLLGPVDVGALDGLAEPKRTPSPLRSVEHLLQLQLPRRRNLDGVGLLPDLDQSLLLPEGHHRLPLRRGPDSLAAGRVGHRMTFEATEGPCECFLRRRSSSHPARVLEPRTTVFPQQVLLGYCHVGLSICIAVLR